MQMEIVSLRHQLCVYQRSVRRPIIEPEDRVIWSWLARRWSGWKEALIFVQPRTVMAWQRKRFRTHWTKLCQGGKPGRPTLSKEVRALIVRMSKSNPSWGSPRIVGELQKLGIQVAKSTVEKYRVRCRKPPSPTWKAFIDNHLKDLVSIDFFTVPTVKFEVPFVLIVLAHHRRKVIHFNVTEYPIAPVGQLSRSWKLFHGIRRRGICCVTAIMSMVPIFASESGVCGSKRWSLRHGVLGRIPRWRESLVRFAASAWTT